MKGMIGLEIHTYLVTDEKLFCRCKNSRERGIKSNVNICPICTGQPGAKPMHPNKEAVDKAVQIALMLGCKVNGEVVWRRKHYSWPDMPKGYQNTMGGGNFLSFAENGKFSGIKISSMHLEEDPASWDPKTGCIDYNRSGLPLVEIVTAPDFTFSEEVSEWLNKLVHALGYLKAVDSNAGIKVDVNVNIPGKTDRVEIKNISSIENVANAIDYELVRQAKEGSVRETRRFDEAKGVTMRMRSKEKQDDYRFIKDPDLLNLHIDKDFIAARKESLPELPDKKISRIVKEYKIDKKNAEILAKNIDIAEFYEKVAKKLDSSYVLPWVTIELLRVLNWNKKSLDQVDVNVDHFVALVKMVKDGKITELQGKQVLNKFIPKSFMPETKGKIEDRDELAKIAGEVIKENKAIVAKYLSGDKNVINYLMGEVMKKTERRADFKVAREVLEELLG